MKYLLLLPLFFVLGCSNESDSTSQIDNIVNAGIEESSSNETLESTQKDNNLDNDIEITEEEAYESETRIHSVGAEVVRKANELDLSNTNDLEIYLNREFFLGIGSISYNRIPKTFSFVRSDADWRFDTDLFIEASNLIKDSLGEGYSIIVKHPDGTTFEVTDGKIDY